MRRREALEPILQLVAIRLQAIRDREHLHVRVVVVPGLVYIGLHVAPRNDVRSRLSNGILQRASDCKGSTNTEHKAEYTAIQLPKPILEPVASRESLQASPARGHGRLVREDAVYDHGVKGDDYQGAADGKDGSHGDGDALMLGEGIVEGPILEGERLVEGFDLVDDHEDGEEDAAMIRKEVARHGRCEGKLTKSRHSRGCN